MTEKIAMVQLTNVGNKLTSDVPLSKIVKLYNLSSDHIGILKSGGTLHGAVMGITILVDFLGTFDADAALQLEKTSALKWGA